MKRLFTGKFRGIPVALLTIALLLTIGAGAVLGATNGGYVLWEGDVQVQVLEPIEAKYGTVQPPGTALTDGVMFDATIFAGSCYTRFFSFRNKADSENCLLLKAIVDNGDTLELPPGVSLTWWLKVGGDPDDLVELGSVAKGLDGVMLAEDYTTDLGVVCGGDTLHIKATVCVDGAAEPTMVSFTIPVQFTRQSPPTPQP